MIGGVLLDTHAAIWMAEGTIGVAPAERIEDAMRRSAIYVSIVTAWEVGMLSVPRRDGRELQVDAVEWFRDLLSLPGVRLAPCTPTISVAASRLPDFAHRDPADRLLIATARELKVPMITRDDRIQAYAETGALAVIPC